MNVTNLDAGYRAGGRAGVAFFAYAADGSCDEDPGVEAGTRCEDCPGDGGGIAGGALYAYAAEVSCDEDSRVEAGVSCCEDALRDPWFA